MRNKQTNKHAQQLQDTVHGIVIAQEFADTITTNSSFVSITHGQLTLHTPTGYVKVTVPTTGLEYLMQHFWQFSEIFLNECMMCITQ